MDREFTDTFAGSSTPRVAPSPHADTLFAQHLREKLQGPQKASSQPLADLIPLPSWDSLLSKSYVPPAILFFTTFLLLLIANPSFVQSAKSKRRHLGRILLYSALAAFILWGSIAWTRS